MKRLVFEAKQSCMFHKNPKWVKIKFAKWLKMWLEGGWVIRVIRKNLKEV